MPAENLSIQPSRDRNPRERSSLTYSVQEIANMLSISKRTAYDFCKKTPDFKVIHVGRCVRVHRESFDKWFAGDAETETNLY